MRFSLRTLMLALVVLGAAASLGARAWSVRTCAHCRELARHRQADGSVDVMGQYDGHGEVPVLRELSGFTPRGPTGVSAQGVFAGDGRVRLVGPNARPGYEGELVRVVGRADRSVLRHVHDVQVESIQFIW